MPLTDQQAALLALNALYTVHMTTRLFTEVLYRADTADPLAWVTPAPARIEELRYLEADLEAAPDPPEQAHRGRVVVCDEGRHLGDTRGAGVGEEIGGQHRPDAEALVLVGDLEGGGSRRFTLRDRPGRVRAGRQAPSARTTEEAKDAEGGSDAISASLVPTQEVVG